MENLICKNAGKSYKEKTVLKNVNIRRYYVYSYNL